MSDDVGSSSKDKIETDLNSIGKHCSFEQCNRLDYLPIKCDFCLKLFCKEHFSLTNHNCPNLSNNPNTNSNSDSNNSQSFKLIHYECTYTDCLVKEIVECKCEFCNLNFCMKHRIQIDHKCAALKQQQSRKDDDTNKKVKEEFKFEMKTNVSEKNTALAAKLLLMKLKQTAEGPPGLTEELKFYCYVQYTTNASRNLKDPAIIKKPFYFSTNWPIGRCIEFFLKKVNVSEKEFNKPRLCFNNDPIDSSLTMQQFVKSFSVNHGIVLELKNLEG